MQYINGIDSEYFSSIYGILKLTIIMGDEELLSFEEIGIKSWLIRQCRGMGVNRPTMVQSKCIPAALKGCDVIGCSKTGSGKNQTRNRSLYATSSSGVSKNDWAWILVSYKVF